MTVPLTRALSCVTIASEHPPALLQVLQGPMGWELCGEGSIDAAREAVWGIAPGSAGDRYWLLRSVGAERGMIRVLRGAERWPQRPIGARWSGVEIVVMEDIDGLCARLEAMPQFRIAKRPRNADFTEAGANVHRFFYGRAPGGTHLMFTMAVTRARDYDFPSADAPVGHVFSAPLVSAEFTRTRQCHADALGMVSILAVQMTEGLWHESWNLEAGSPVDLDILRGDAPGIGHGHIELQGYESKWIDPAPLMPDRFDGGSCLVTYTVTDLDTACARLRAHPGVRLCTPEPQRIDAGPDAGGRTLCFVAPTGERMELCERFGAF